MNNKVKPSAVLSKTIKNLLNGNHPTDQLLTDLLRLGAERILQETAEGEVDEFLGRGWYQRRQEQDGEHRGYRNGYTPVNFKTTQGPITVQRPRIRDNEEPFQSAVLSRIQRLEERLVTLVTEIYVRGIPTRDVDQTLVTRQGEPVLSR